MSKSNVRAAAQKQTKAFPAFILKGRIIASPSSLQGRVPECFADHILIRDAVVGQGLAPDRVECVVQGLGSKFIGLKDKQKSRSVGY